MADTPPTTQAADTGPPQIDTPPYPGTTRIENGQAYDVSGKSLGAVDDNGVAAGTASKTPIDYDALAKQAGSIGSAPSSKAPVDYDALAKQAGSIGSAPAKGAVDYDALAKQAGSTGSAPVQEKPGAVARYFHGAGLPTTTAELPSFLEHIALPGYAALKDAPQEIKDYVTKTVGDLEDIYQEQKEALQNVSEGGPFWSNLNKGILPIVKFGLHQVPFVGEPEYQAGEDVTNKNYAGAAGGLTSVIAQVVLPEILHGTSEGARLDSAIKEHASAKTILDARTSERDIATQQAKKAADDASVARSNNALQPQQKIEVQNNASAAQANATKAQKAFDEAQTARNEAAVKANNLIRRAAVKAQKEADFHQQVLENQRKAKVKAGTPEEVADSIKDFQAAIPPGVGKAAYTPKDAAAVRPVLEKAHATSPVDSPQDVVDALESNRVSRDNEVRGLVRDGGKYANEPLLLTDDAGNAVSVKQKLVDALSEDEKTRPGFTEAALKELERFNTTDPTLDEADKLRETLNSENRDKLNTPQGKRAILDARETDPEFAARYELQDILRDGIYGRLEEKGVKNARESRQLDASVIRVKNAALRQIGKADKVVRGSSDVGAFRKGAAKVSTLAGAGAGATLGAATGIPLAPEVGAVIGAGAGRKVGTYIAPPDLTRGDLIKRSLDVKHPPVEIPRVDVTGARPSAPPSEPLPPNVATPTAPVNPRENTEIHAALATHYDEQIGDTPYDELENRFLADVATKKKYHVPLDPAEKKINNEINKSKVEEILKARGEAEEQKKAAEKAAADAEKASEEAEKEKQEKEAQGLKTNLASPFETESHLNPEDERALHHELGHHFQIAKAGHPTQDIIGRQHPQIDTGAQAEARWNPEAFFDENGKLDIGKVRDNIESLLDIFHGGAIADEVMNDVPVHKNSGAKTDLRRARTKLIEAGFSPSEAGQLMSASEARVRKDFTTPGVRDIFQRYSQAREAGLDPGLLMNEETSGRAIQEFKNAMEGGKETNNETNNKSKTPRQNGGSNREGKPGGTGRVPSKGAGASGTARPQGENVGGAGGEGLQTNLKGPEAPSITEIIPELKNHPEIAKRMKDLGFEGVLQKEWSRQEHEKLKNEPVIKTENKAPQPTERSTGNEAYDAAIKEGGGVPGGVMDLGEFGRIYNYHDPKTGSTLGFKEGQEINPETVRAQIQKSREAFGLKTEKATPKADFGGANEETTAVRNAISEMNLSGDTRMADGFLQRAVTTRAVESPAALDNVVRTTRALAKLDGKTRPELVHLSEAIQYESSGGLEKTISNVENSPDVIKRAKEVLTARDGRVLNSANSVSPMTQQDAEQIEKEWPLSKDNHPSTRAEAAGNIGKYVSAAFKQNPEVGAASKNFFTVKDSSGKVFGAMNIDDRSINSKEPYVIVRNLATNPEILSGGIQAKGVGTTLLRHAAKVAADAKAPLILFGDANNAGFYKKMGGREVHFRFGPREYRFEWTPEQAERLAVNGPEK